MNQRIPAALLAMLLASGSVYTALPAKAASVWNAEIVSTCEAEEGVLSGKTRIENGTCVTGFERDGDLCTVSVIIPEAGFYDLEFVVKPLGGYKENYVLVDGQRIGTISCDGGQYVSAFLRRIYLEAGTHTVAVSKYWGYIQWDKLNVLTCEPFDETIFEVPAKLVNENATDNAKRLFSYLCDQYGKNILSGQYCETGYFGWENMRISEQTGRRYPAILGMDMGYYSQTGKDHNVSIQTTELAKTCWEKGGIVTLCWHWLAPQKYITGTWYSAFRPEEIKMNLTAIMNGEDEEGMALLNQDIDNIAQELLKLQDAGVPILWRPLHEASGGWFWWGAEGAETYKKLYLHLYHTLTEQYGLNNLIWLWNGQNPDWYPGDEYVDIIGTDIYAGEHAYASQIDQFLSTLHSTDSRKMVVLSENGTLIDPDLAVRDRAMWGFFCTWSGEFVIEDGLKKKYSEKYTEIEMLKKVYASDAVITREELPDLHTYPIREDAT